MNILICTVNGCQRFCAEKRVAFNFAQAGAQSISEFEITNSAVRQKPSLVQYECVLRFKKFPRQAFGFGVVIAFLGSTSMSPQEPGQKQVEKLRVHTAASVLASTYNQSTGLFQGTGWWNSANGITALVDVSRNLKTREFDGILHGTFNQAQHNNPAFLNEFYDDEGWWALAWVDAYRLRHDKRYLNMAEAIFTDMSGGWSDTCGGGIWWKKNERYKNAIANELFLSVAVQLAEVNKGKARARFLNWAQKEEKWFLSSGLINAEFLVNDGLDASCKNNGRTTWTYNQGVLLTGLAGLHQVMGDEDALLMANKIASAASTQLTDAAGILHDTCEPNCGEDGVQFKGILVRNLVSLEESSPSAPIKTLIENNANSIWEHARTKGDHFSVVWTGPSQDSGTGALISALDALTAALSESGK